MARTAFLCLSLLLLSASTMLLSLNGCGSSKSSTSTIVPDKLQHIVVIFQENRTPDNLFHDPALIAKGADIASTGLNSKARRSPGAGCFGPEPQRPTPTDQWGLYFWSIPPACK